VCPGDISNVPPAERPQFSCATYARLVSVDAFGHTILGFSTCADDIATRYLIELKAPRPGIVCQPNIPPFPTSA